MYLSVIHVNAELLIKKLIIKEDYIIRYFYSCLFLKNVLDIYNADVASF
jgi:hypothetical protein